MLHLFRINRYNATRCMILHPVSFPNKGPIIQQYLAQQAVGLANSLNWEIIKGPYWNTPNNRIIVPTQIKNKQQNNLLPDDNHQQLRDGQYVDTIVGRGILYGQGVIFDPCESESDGDLHKQWQNKLVRESIANSSLIKTRRITQKYYFTKGKLQGIAKYIKMQNIDCVFINKQLKPTQLRNLTKIIQSKINNFDAIYFKPNDADPNDSQTQFQSQDIQALVKSRGNGQYKKIKIFDRFSIILQIFAQRTTSKLSKLQIQLSFLNYLKTRLTREGSTFSSNLNIFYGDLMKASEVNLQIVSAKQRRAAFTMSGQGQSQLQHQRRNIKEKEAKIKKQIQEQTRLRIIKSQKNERKSSRVPVVALVGYTNVGKSAFMNAVLKKNEVQSKDMLFQTLKTTSRYVTLISGKKINLLDTIGFISDLPVELIESFKTTLEQVSHADLVIHLRDISNPQHQLQKNSVVKILSQMGFSEKFYQKNMIQVWNKIDLISKNERQALKKDQNQNSIKSISCTTGTGLKDLMHFIDQKLRDIAGLSQKTIQYSIDIHSKLLQWIKQNTNLTYNLNQQFNYEGSEQFPNGSVKLHLDVDDATYGKILKFINPEETTKNNKTERKKNKGMPPSNW